jgi:hypothetical protein
VRIAFRHRRAGDEALGYGETRFDCLHCILLKGWFSRAEKGGKSAGYLRREMTNMLVYAAKEKRPISAEMSLGILENPERFRSTIT